MGLIQAGNLDKRVRIQAVIETDDGGGGQTQAWTDVATVWASITPGFGREFTTARQLTPELSHVITIRYRSWVTAKHRIVYGSRIFPIHAVADTNERHEQLVLTCSELTPTTAAVVYP